MKDRSRLGHELSSPRRCERAQTPARFHPAHTPVCVPLHTPACAHADTPTGALTTGPHLQRALSRQDILGFTGLYPPLSPSLHPSSLPIHSFRGFSVCAWMPPKPEARGWLGGEGRCKRRGGPRAPGAERGGEGAGSGRAGGAPGPRASPAAAAPGRRARPGPGAAARLSRSLSDAPRPSRAGGLRPPGSRGQRWVAQAGGAAALDPAAPGRPLSVGASGVVPGAPSEGWGFRRGEWVAREGLQIWGVLRRIPDFKGLFWPCLAERVRGGGLAGKGCGHVALNS